MKSCLTLVVLAGFAIAGWSQTAQKSAATPPPAQTHPAIPASTDLKARGPEAIAAKDPNKVVATVNGKQITAKQAWDLLKILPENQRRQAPNLQTLFEQLYAADALAEKAIAEGLDKQSPVKEQLQLGRDQILARAYMQHLTDSNTQPAGDPKQYYDAHPGQFDQAKLSGIVITFNAPGTPAAAGGANRTEEQARAKADDLEKKIKSGTDVTALARTDSDDQRSATAGGQLGTLTQDAPNVPADIKDAVFTKLQPGQVSEPIRAGNAFYILKLESRTKETFDQARPEIEQKLQAEKNQTVMKQEVDKYKVQVEDTDFFGASAPARTPSLANPSGTPSSAPPAPAKPETQK